MLSKFKGYLKLPVNKFTLSIVLPSSFNTKFKLCLTKGLRSFVFTKPCITSSCNISLIKPNVCRESDLIEVYLLLYLELQGWFFLT